MGKGDKKPTKSMVKSYHREGRIEHATGSHTDSQCKDQEFFEGKPYVLVYGAAVTNYQKAGGLKQQNFILLIVLEARSLKSKYWQDGTQSEDSREDIFLASPRSCGCLLSLAFL